MSTLRVSLDVSAVPPQPAGAGRYTIELARALAKREDVDLTLVTRRGDAQRFEVLGAGDVAPVVPDQRLLRLGYERLLLGRHIDGRGVDVHHGPHYTMPTTRTPVVVTIHDLTFFDRPEVHEAAKVRFFRHAIERAAKEAACLVCVSQRTADDLARVVAVEAPVVIATHGIDHERFQAEEPVVGADARVLDSLGLDPSRRRVVALGTLEPRKGIGALIAAVSPLLVQGIVDELVLVGQRGWGVAEIDRAIAMSPAAGSIRQLGYVDDEAVPTLLRTAEVVAYPSLDEGFGLPALEALACGARLVTTHGSVMADLCGDVPWLAAADDATSLRAALLQALDAPPLEVARRRSEGIELARGATWEQAAARHVAAYRRATESLPGTTRSH